MSDRPKEPAQFYPMQWPSLRPWGGFDIDDCSIIVDAESLQAKRPLQRAMALPDHRESAETGGPLPLSAAICQSRNVAIRIGVATAPHGTEKSRLIYLYGSIR